MSRNSGAVRGCNKEAPTCGCPAPATSCGKPQQNGNGCSQAKASPCRNQQNDDTCFKPKNPCPAVQPQKPSRCSQAREEIKNMCKNSLPASSAKPSFGGCSQPKTNNDCNSLNSKQPVSKYLEAISDIVGTLVEILCICGVHYCKAKRATNTLINAFIKFDELPQENCKDMKKKIRKNEFFANIAAETSMTGTETLQTYAAAKYAFKAFYHKQSALFYNPAFIDECKWHRAAQKTFIAFSKFNSGLSCSHMDNVEKLIKSTYDDYVERFRLRCLCDGEPGPCPKKCPNCKPPCPTPPPCPCFTQPPKPKCKCCKPKPKPCCPK